MIRHLFRKEFGIRPAPPFSLKVFLKPPEACSWESHAQEPVYGAGQARKRNFAFGVRDYPHTVGVLGQSYLEKRYGS